MEAGPALSSVLGALLKRPGQVAYEIIQGDARRVVLTLLAAISLCMMAYGLLMGSFAGGHQVWVVPLKLWIGCLFSALLCLPSLYIFACLSGGKLSLAQISGLLLQGIALSALLLVGFAPIAWIFSQSTNTVAFMGFLHLAFGIVSVYFGLRLLTSAIEFLNEERMQVLHVWGVIFILVVCQMCTYLRPLVAEFEGFRLQEKQFFLANWQQTVYGK
jgi:hypothetical protein